MLLSVIDSSCSSAVHKRRTHVGTLADGQKTGQSLVVVVVGGGGGGGYWGSWICHKRFSLMRGI